MRSTKFRQQVAYLAARLMYHREVSEYYQAKWKAARQLGRGWIRPSDLPSNAEIRDQVQCLARLLEGPDHHHQRLLEMRLRALWWMNRLVAFHPRLIGSVLTGHVREGSDIDLHVFAGSALHVAAAVDEMGGAFEIERKRIVKDGQAREFTHIHLRDEFPIELTVYAPSQLGHRFRSSITGKPIEKATIAELQKRIAIDHQLGEHEITAQLDQINTCPDRANVFLSLLLPLENVKQDARYHPEGDALFHSMQVYALAKDTLPYDEEFLLAALLHDVGKAIEPSDHVRAGLEALEGYVSERTAWLIAHHMQAHQMRDATLGARRRRRLAQHPWIEELQALSRCDREGRVPGAEVEEPEQALDYIEQLETMFG
ncbi:HD domain-containing protein [Roseiconus nitratireducens]|uniref:HD domain-containing protein n=1 Tax=Roseiconus nitratireducens TaxID=2605748 RepID=A0A5M6D3T3_9BACT|nr:HD domain-containing protein [Roseiconus nitratireducens]KAA5540942.1 HD domain-containing protein [Roseiconus nitratireducens]